MRTIHKLQSDTNQRYVRVPSYILEVGLSSDAFYLYVWILDKPDDWDIAKPEVMAKQIEIMGRDRCYKALKELESAMLFVRGKVRNKSGSIIKHTRELHALPLTENQEVVQLTDIQEVVKNQAKTKTCKKRLLPDIQEVAKDGNNETKTTTYEDSTTSGISGSISKKQINKQINKKTNKKDRSDFQIALDEYNELADRTGLPRCRLLNKDRTKKLGLRLEEHGLDGWRQALANIERSSFLCGEKGDWKASFDFLMQPSSFLKTIEGQYGNGRVRKSNISPERKKYLMELAAAEPSTIREDIIQ